MRSSNPMLREDTFSSFGNTGAIPGASVMTLQGTVMKTAILLVLAFTSAIFCWMQPEQAKAPFMIGGLIVGVISSLICIFAPRWAGMLSPVYAIGEGLFLGGISSFIDQKYPGVALQAMTATFGTLGSLLFAYTTRLIKVTENFKLGVAAATGGIFLMYLASFIMSLFGMQMPYVHDAGPIGIGVSLVIVIVAALNLVLDFDFIETGVEQGAPKYMEWYAAFGLLVTLVWLYIEFLKLFAKLSKRD